MRKTENEGTVWRRFFIIHAAKPILLYLNVTDRTKTFNDFERGPPPTDIWCVGTPWFKGFEPQAFKPNSMAHLDETFSGKSDSLHRTCGVPNSRLNRIKAHCIFLSAKRHSADAERRVSPPIDIRVTRSVAMCLYSFCSKSKTVLRL